MHAKFTAVNLFSKVFPVPLSVYDKSQIGRKVMLISLDIDELAIMKSELTFIILYYLYITLQDWNTISDMTNKLNHREHLISRSFFNWDLIIWKQKLIFWNQTRNYNYLYQKYFLSSKLLFFFYIQNYFYIIVPNNWCQDLEFDH